MKTFILIIALTGFACDDPGGGCPANKRTGAVCNDGTTSTATGSGACSHHQGVDHWICK